jgi:hypothetical protein
MKIRSSTKIGLGFALLAILSLSGYKFYMDLAIRNEHFDPPVPGKVNLVGIDPGAGYKILVANQMAQLVEANEDFGGNESDSGGATDGAVKKRIPIREMLEVLRGEEDAVGPFVMTMNDMSENDLPPVAPTWKAEDLEKALESDGPLRKKLVRDLNMKLDGTPLSELRIASLENGIIVDSPVPVRVSIDGKATTIVGRVLEAYKPRVMQAAESRYADKPNLTRAMQAGYYQEEASKVLSGDAQKEDIAQSLRSMISETVAKRRAEAAERVLRSATVVVNESHITKAEKHEYDTTDGKRYNLQIRLTDEGRRRLWKHSHDRVGTQLLLIADGVAIAAPRISHELSQGELTITQMRDRVLVDDAERMLNKATAAP